MTETTNETQKPEDETQASEPEAAVEETEAGQAEPDLAAEVADLKDRLLRTMAETENLRKRAERERQDASKYAIASFARDLLTVADNLRRGLENLPGEEARDDTLKSFGEGMELTERELLKAFEKAGIRRIDPLGEKFDHNFHEAMFEVPTADQPAGTVIQVIEPGYVIHDRLLRAARVGVARAAEGAAGDAKVDTRV